jgi:alpha-L-fucosidase
MNVLNTSTAATCHSTRHAMRYAPWRAPSPGAMRFSALALLALGAIATAALAAETREQRRERMAMEDNHRMGDFAPLPLGNTEESLPKPTPQHLAWQDLEFGLLISLASQFQDPANKDVDCDTLDPRQWAKVTKASGAKYATLCVKWANCYCLYFSDLTRHRVKKRDILRETIEAFRDEGLQVGVYFGSQVWIKNEPDYVKEEWKDNRFGVKLLEEILAKYPGVLELWFDGGMVGDHRDLKRYREIQPRILAVLGGPDARYIGEGRVARPDETSIHALGHPHVSYRQITKDTALSLSPDGKFAWAPAYADIALDGWFSGKNPHSVKVLMTWYERTVGRNANLLLGVAVEPDGLIHPNSVKVLEEFGAELRRRYSEKTLLGKTQGTGKEFKIPLDGGDVVTTIVLQEDIADSERVRKYVVEGEIDGWGGWKTLAEGTVMGHKRIHQVAPEPVFVNAVRLRILESVGTPKIRSFAVHNINQGESEEKKP